AALERLRINADHTLEVDASQSPVETARAILVKLDEFAKPRSQPRSSVTDVSEELNEPWARLFASRGQAGEGSCMQMWLLRRSGTSFLILPDAPRLAAKSLALYPAQTPKARMAKLFLHTALGFGLYPGTEKLSLAFRPNDAFAKYLSQVAGGNGLALAPFAMLAG